MEVGQAGGWKEKRDEGVPGSRWCRRDGGVAWKMEYLNVKGWVENVPRYSEG